MRAKRLKRPRRSSQTTAARASCARSAPNDRVVKETTASCVPNASNDRVLRRNDAGLQGMLCPLHKTTLDYKVFHAHCIKRHWITRYSMPVTRNDTGFSTAINVAAKCPPIMLRWHPGLFRYRNCFGTETARTRRTVRRIPAVSVPPNPTWLRSCPVSVCFGPETLALRPRNVEFRLSPRTNTCGLHARAAVCHLPPGGCETVSVPKQFRYRNSSGGRNSSGAETVSVPKQFRYRNTL